MYGKVGLLSIKIFFTSDENKPKYRLAKWDIVCKTKDQGGWGIENLEVKNKCLLTNCYIGFR